MTHKFKALMHCGQFVDHRLLEKGVYMCHIPHIMPAETTLQDIRDQALLMRGMTVEAFISGRYFENLDQCELVDIEIKV